MENSRNELPSLGPRLYDRTEDNLPHRVFPQNIGQEIWSTHFPTSLISYLNFLPHYERVISDWPGPNRQYFDLAATTALIPNRVGRAPNRGASSNGTDEGPDKTEIKASASEHRVKTFQKAR